MARTFRRPRAAHPISELNVTNLIDLAFTLLIIFMISTPLIQSEQTMPVNLPVESKSQQSKPDPDTRFETITIRANGSCLLGQKPVPIANLKKALATFAAEPKQPVFRIRADKDASVQNVISVMDALKQNGLTKVTFDTQTGS